MHIKISSADHVGDDAMSALAGWLNRDRDVTRTATVVPASSGVSGSMGACDVINVTLTHVEAISGILLAYASWRQSRSKVPAITLRSETVQVTINDASPATIDKVLTLFAAADEPEAARPAAGDGGRVGAVA
jgi:hypothetical protein